MSETKMNMMETIDDISMYKKKSQISEAWNR